MNLFRLTLFAAGLAIFLALRFFASRAPEPQPLNTPRAAPAETTNDPFPFLHHSSEGIFALAQ